MRKIGPDPKLLVFDLDGTLADSKPDIIDAVNVTMERLGLTPLPASSIIGFVGDGSKILLKRCLKRINRFEKKLHMQAHEFFFDYYCENVFHKTRAYPGVESTLSQLPGIKAVLTNKPAKMAEKLLSGLGIASYFDNIIGFREGQPLKPDPHFLLTLIDKYRVLPRDTWMIGDSPVDVLTARNAGAKSVAVLYGFTPPEKLSESRPDLSVTAFSELLDLFT